jgi:peptidoglycan hydrolase-like protein with peptidoglycan-binding domain
MNRTVIAALATAALCIPAMAAQHQAGTNATNGTQAQIQTQANNTNARLQRQIARQRMENAQNQRLMASYGPNRIGQVQTALSKKGFDVGNANGKWQPQWKTALERFQAKNGLFANGMLNRRTLMALSLNPSDFGFYGPYRLAGQPVGRNPAQASGTGRQHG